MSQNITIQGASYNDVPSIEVPKTLGGIAKFVDVSDTTATADKVQQGFEFYLADGTKATGTSSGGGGGTITIGGGIRYDAEKVKTWNYDKYVVADEHVTLPSYSTNAVTLVASADIDTYVADHTQYSYMITERILSIPIYKSSYTSGSGKEEYVLSAIDYELVYAPSNAYSTLDGSKAYATANPALVNHGQHCRFLRWTNATTLGLYTSAAYGVGHTYTAPTIVANGTLTIKSPVFQIRGHATYLKQEVFEALDDIRNQYVIELWRVPKDQSKPNGYDLYSQVDSILNDIKNNNQKLR